MKKYVKNERQIIRIDGKNVFFEVMSDAFEIGKVKINFRSYDNNRPKGDKFTSQVDIYIPLEKMLALCDAILSYKLYDSAVAKTKNTNSIVDIWKYQGGSMPEIAKRDDGMALSREVKIQKGIKFILFASSGAGEVQGTGIIVPKGKRENEIKVPLEYPVLTEVAAITKAHIQAFLNAKYTLRALNPETNNNYNN